MALHWHEWSDEVVRVSRDERRPILLVLGVDWGRTSAEYRRRVLGDTGVEAVLAEHAIAVWADAAAHPELVALYGQGAWPTVAALDAEGRLLGGGTGLEARALKELVRDAARRCRDGSAGDPPAGPATGSATGSATSSAGSATGSAARPAPEAAMPRHVSPARPAGPARAPVLEEAILPAIEDAMLAHFDERHGGFGTGAKFPHPEALDFALLRFASTGSPRLAGAIEKTLGHMADGALHDRVDGGFFRYARQRDWTLPDTEKPLALNAGLARNYLEAGQVMGRADYLEVGATTIDWLCRHLLDAEGGLFHASLDPADDWYALEASGRRTRPGPRPDGRFLADANARAVSALLKAGAVLRRDELTERALGVADALLARLWRAGRGMYHFDDGHGRQRPGRLKDQAETARALLRLLQYTDERRFVPALDDLLRLIATQHVRRDGGFADRDVAAAARPARDDENTITDSSVAAEVLLRGALFTGRPELAEVAYRGLRRHAGDFRRYGHAMTPFGRSVELLLHPPLHIVVVGAVAEAAAADEHEADTRALLTAASETYLPSRVVQRLDPVEDVETLERLGLSAREPPTAYVFTARDVSDHTDPRSLRQSMLAANQRRLSG